jgi:hypothetical protein
VLSKTAACLLRSLGHDSLDGKIPFLDPIVVESAAVDQHGATAQVPERLQIGVLPHEDRVVYPGGGSREVEVALADGRAEHAGIDVDLPVLELLPDLRPWTKLHLVLEPHLVGHRPKQVHVEAGGLPLGVAELVGWIGLVDADDDGLVGLLGADRSRSKEHQHQPGEGTHRRPIHGTPAAMIPSAKLAEDPASAMS